MRGKKLEVRGKKLEVRSKTLDVRTALKAINYLSVYLKSDKLLMAFFILQ